MARPRAFDEGRAVDAAMRAFWTAGYDATSTQDLCAATGLGRSSIYNTFASKQDLFDKALRRYMADRDRRTFEVLDGPLPVKEKVRALFWAVVEPNAEEPLGCFVINSTVELAPHDKRIARMLRRNQDKRFAAIRAALAAGELAAEQDPDALAHFVVATIGALQVTARGGANKAVLASIATTALSVF